MEQRKIIPVLAATLLVGAAARADLMPPSGLAPDPESALQFLSCRDLPRSSAAGLWAGLVMADLDSRTRGILSDAPQSLAETPETPRQYVLADRQTGVSLCLYALLGLGLCKSVPGARRFALGCLPQWYHEGGPYQIGHSLALSPDCRSPVPVYCFIQPQGQTETSKWPHSRETTIALWRRSQFTPTRDAPRGPPHLSYGDFTAAKRKVMTTGRMSGPPNATTYDSKEKQNEICSLGYLRACGACGTSVCRHLLSVRSPGGRDSHP